MNYYIADLHLFHKNMVDEGKNMDNRPFATIDEMHHAIGERWNARVTPKDTVYVLGDMSMYAKGPELVEYVSSLNGHKYLIRGNHDKISNSDYRALYEDICAYKEVKDFYYGDKKRLILSHYPILMWNHQHHKSIHLYGHVHNTQEEGYFQKCVREMSWNEDGDMIAINVGCMMPYMSYTPRTLTELLDGYYERVPHRKVSITNVGKSVKV